MTRTVQGFFLSCGLIGAAAFGQSREFGVIGGIGFAPGLTLSGPAGSAQTGFRNGGVVGVFLGQDPYPHLGGEIRYLYRMSDMKLSAGGVSTKFDARTQIVHMDLLLHARPGEAAVRPFVAFGGGVKLIQGTGAEASYQPLHEFAALTKTLQVQPTGDVGIGVKVLAGRHLRVRFEVRDYISAKPDKVIAASPGFQLGGGVMHDILGLAALSVTW